ncbi:COG1361 S-layer family protein [Geoglobus sp.]
MRRVIMLLIAATMLMGVSSALSYEDKPYFTAYIAQSNHIDAGQESTVIVVLQNSARLWKQSYDSIEEYNIISKKPEMLTTAYNVSVRFESDGLKVKTPEMFFPALPAFQPVQIPVVIDARDVRAGEYELTLNISYEVVDDVSIISQTSVIPFPSRTVYYYNLSISPTLPVSKEQILDNQTLYYLDYLKFTYDEKEQTIRLKIVVEKPDVLLNVTEVQSDLVAGGKGKITVTVKNDGRSRAENLFLILTTPSGFRAEGLQQVSLEDYTKALQSIAYQNPQLSTLGLQDVRLSLPPQLQVLMSQGTVYVGELSPGDNVTVSFSVDVNTDEGGYYPFQIYGVYTLNGEVKQTPARAFGVSVRDKPEINVIGVNSSVYAGSKGDVEIRINASEILHSLRARLETKPPLTALSEEYFAGDVSSAVLRFRVKASGDAENTVYPAKLKIYYDVNGKEVEESFDIGIKVGKKIRFEVIGKGEIPAGDERVITVRIKNAGEVSIKDATARITVVDPFSTTDDSSYIGELRPREEKEVSFRIKADRDATPKSYALNLEIKYRDFNGEWVISDPVKLPIDVTESQKTIPSAGVVLAAVSILLAAYWMRR